MENSINNQPGASTAQTPNVNPNPKPESKNQMPKHHKNKIVDLDDTPSSLKANAERYQCYLGTLKNNVRNGRLQALQEGPNAPYLVKPSDVEKLLRETPGIASIFHPAGSRPAKTTHPKAQQPEPKKVEPASTATSKHEPKIDTSTPAKAERCSAVDRPVTEGGNASTPVSDTPQSSHPRKRRRRGRGRGKSGAVQSNPSSVKSLALRALNGSSPEERLRITACLNELASLVASA